MSLNSLGRQLHASCISWYFAISSVAIIETCCTVYKCISQLNDNVPHAIWLRIIGIVKSNKAHSFVYTLFEVIVDTKVTLSTTGWNIGKI